MIHYLKGKLMDCQGSEWTVLVGGVGYGVLVLQGRNHVTPTRGGEVELYIHPHVREDAFELFGFSKLEERNLFKILIGVNGIGPKAAIGILSSVDPSQLVSAVLGADQSFLTKIPGIGKKTADRIILELKDQFKKKAKSGELQALELSSSDGASERTQPGQASFMDPDLMQDVKTALVGLGYREQDVSRLLEEISRKEEFKQAKISRVEDVIRFVLRELR